MYTILNTELYSEWKFQNRSKYLVTNTVKYRSCVFNEMPAHDLVAWIFSRSTKMDRRCSRSADTLKIFMAARALSRRRPWFRHLRCKKREGMQKKKINNEPTPATPDLPLVRPKNERA
uniref:Uncharacterized protein n=1 Tax=Chloropicon laureae TaxID=464258 RepID=A0A7S3E4J8_9CHLO